MKIYYSVDKVKNSKEIESLPMPPYLFSKFGDLILDVLKGEGNKMVYKAFSFMVLLELELLYIGVSVKIT